MAEWNAFYHNEDEEEEQEEGEQSGDYRITGRDSLVFLVDASKEMFIKGEDGQPSNFDMTMQVVRSVYMSKIISSHRDLVALVFYGTEQSKNPRNSFKHVYVYHDLDEPGAKRVQDIDSLRGEKGAQLAAETMGSGETSFGDALWCCANLYSDIKLRLSHKRLMIFTCRDEPHGGDSVKDRQARTKAGDLKETGVVIDLMHLMKPGGFNVSLFFCDIISPLEDESELGLQVEPCEKLDDLKKRVRAKEQKKRAMARLNLCLGEGLNVAVGIYPTAVTARKPVAIRLYRETNEPVRSKTRTFHTQTGSLLLPSEIKKAQVYGNKQIVMEKDEVDAIKKFDDPGLLLIGFKPMEKLKLHHHIRPAVFLYPEEDQVKGSACLFSALLKKCSERNVFALCRCITRRNNPPRFAALVPQLQEVDEGNAQITPPGFNVIYLPFADDLRTLDPPHYPAASQVQVDKMKEIVSKLRFKYRSDSFENPVIQQHYRNLEALALDMMAPEDIEDLIMPKVEQIDQRLGPLVDEFKDLVYPENYNPESKPAAKRKTADSGGGAEKKPKVEVTEDELKVHVQNGTLAKLTVPVLKEACKQFGVRTTGTKKQELIDALIAKLG
ncbi:X-ray repair cross-complementing protein 6 isoform X2 [Acanthochromis polyacanthus]|uniref:DNA helicase n=1 Tax=Acanthochromis polyacanthus TaxID=80966 RepID=A0A3Q1F2E8_9TELE|nr:X-ray repair cross-complementing protein 6 isoform X2 [Acanthochromis polyacanthus]XP_022054709.1 X-ray repair cross-complementing protein 6 isoform X2 [Acanthochromis polyacanthus]XP_022054712.1 X-ray repair cross-complementing protein 6 isoform X2 [Acanthochromis polyacanthus]XP_022054713.1 X-ray repair cross-complementing protein 6 isoform X2 [Acanthochromis polyacanthus]XP_022054714.1 X-ray repair cross-complementing protein 6 isoform X2 [Acanthochromis polyacanthus]